MSIPEFAAILSAACAVFTAYMYRSQGKGFVWTKDFKLILISEPDGRIHYQIDIPLFNLGKRAIQFISLSAKKVNMETKAMDNFFMDMYDAHFPDGVFIISYRTAIYSELLTKGDMDKKVKLLISEGGKKIEGAEVDELQKTINQKIEAIPEHIIILKCLYKDGSWFGRKTKKTFIGLSIKDKSINYLSTARRKELNEYFAW